MSGKRYTDEEILGSYRYSLRRSRATDAELLKMADRLEQRINGHECGHQFTITFTSTMHSGIAGEGPESHVDGDWASEPASVTVRANDLATALQRAATLPLSAWFPSEDGDHE